MKKFTILGVLIMIALFGVVLFRQPPVISVGAHTNPTPTPTPIVDNCNHSCPVVEWTYTYCPSNADAYKSTDSSKPCSKKFGSGRDAYTKYADKVKGNAFSVTYEKSQDPNKCHRPSSDTLEDKVKDGGYGMSSDERKAFNDENLQTKDSERIVPEGYYFDGKQCVEQTKVCTDPEATNYDSEVGKNEKSDQSVCTYPEKKDYCSNLEDIQETLPDGMESDEENFCSCKTGYHEVVVINDVKTIVATDGYSNFTCEADIPTPSPTPEPRQPDPGSCNGCGQVPTAYQCPNGDIKQLPQALFVFRSGKEAKVQWFRTGGDQVNILYKELGQPSWTHALRDQPNKEWNSYTISDLNPKLGYVFGVMQKDGCGGGEIAVAVVEDGPTTQIFPVTSWEWFK